ncbi:hypothetical protein FFLO_03150 [Filobasidium floriforme]|uniref:Uncharacterized protein n=1 Tax=Filobasidium floriforme TaxID=5210 RepID=A0A8K0JRJ9_9TREE|nr:uncharacterized protein HD553DRAFT_307673 [Filobasidium floriforme]KAG7548945.1 hypothetical protein FFLO_03150 [Filobasidium floriforme]KAH8088237.1 hypothetical protein HD553DRAFT_307673 [Filobasidium floriforme]
MARKDDGIVWDFDTISSVFFLLLFLVIVAGVFHLTRKGAAAAEQTKASLREKGVTYQDGQMKVQTTGVAPNREEYIARTQRAFERSAAKFAAHPAALTFGLKEDLVSASQFVGHEISSLTGRAGGKGKRGVNGNGLGKADRMGGGGGDTGLEGETGSVQGLGGEASGTGAGTPAPRRFGGGMFRRNPSKTS